MQRREDQDAAEVGQDRPGAFEEGTGPDPEGNRGQEEGTIPGAHRRARWGSPDQEGRGEEVQSAVHHREGRSPGGTAAVGGIQEVSAEHPEAPADPEEDPEKGCQEQSLAPGQGQDRVVICSNLLRVSKMSDEDETGAMRQRMGN